MDNEAKFGLATFIFGVGLEVAGITVPYLGYGIMLIGGLLLCDSFFDVRKRIASLQWRRNRPNAASLSAAFDELVDNRWVMHLDPPSATAIKSITFKSNGTIGEGRNANEFKWTLEEGETLAIWTINGALQNRFQLQTDGVRYYAIRDPDAVGLDRQTITRT